MNVSNCSQPASSGGRRQRGFTMVEFTIVAGLVTLAALVALQIKIGRTQQEVAQRVSAEILTIQDAATSFYAQNTQWPDEANNCAGAIARLQTDSFLIGNNNSFWGPNYVTTCTGGPPRTLFTVSTVAPALDDAEIAGSRVISAEINTVGGVTTLSSTVGIPGTQPGVFADRFLHRVQIPGRPELNRMETTLTMGDPATPGSGVDLDMNGNNIIGLNELRGTGGPINLPDGAIFGGPSTFNAAATFNNGLTWGDSELAIGPGNQGRVDLGSLGAAPGVIRFHIAGGLISTLTAVADGLEVNSGMRVTGLLDARANANVQGELDVLGEARLQLGAIVSGGNLEVRGGGGLGQGIFDAGLTICSAGINLCGLSGVAPGGGGVPAWNLIYTNGNELILGGPGDRTRVPLYTVNATQMFLNVDQTLFVGSTRSEGIVSGRDVRTLSGDSLSRAAQDISVVANGTVITKPLCGPSAPRPEIYLALSQIAAGNPAPAMHQIAAFAEDLGNRWVVRVNVLTPTGVVSPPPAFGQLLSIIKCEV